MTKRTRSDSVTAALAATQAAGSETIRPPGHVTLRDGDWPYWESIVRARAKDSWNNSDLENAASLARCKADVERIQLEIESEGDVIENARGTPIINPKHSLIETLTRRAMALSRMLHVHAEATVGESRDSGKKAKLQRDAERTADELGGDDLIPGLRAVK